jgi:SPP1 family phage portal protein
MDTDLLQFIQEGKYATDSDMITDIKTQLDLRAVAMKDMYKRYKGKVPVLDRTLPNPNKVNNKLANDFYGTIIDDKVGYMGNSIRLNVDQSKYSEADYEKLMDFINDWNRENQIDDLNATTTKLSAICGYSTRLLFNGTEGARVRNPQYPWETYVVYSDDTGEPLYGFWFYDKFVAIEGGGKTKQDFCELYTDKLVKLYKRVAVGWELVEEKPHMFSFVPMIIVPNNDEYMGDFEKVTTLIEAYDNALSDGSSEFEQLRLAYAVLKGANLDAEQMELMKQTGIMCLDDPTADFSFVSKAIDMASVKILLDEVRKNIFQFAKSVDFSEVATGQIPVIGWKIKLMQMENKCKIFERKFSAALRYQYKVLADYWGMFNGVILDYKDLSFKFIRNIPNDILGEAQTLGLLKGMVSDKTALGLMSFVDSPDEEIKQMKAEEALYIDIDEEDNGLAESNEQAGNAGREGYQAPVQDSAR